MTLLKMRSVIHDFHRYPDENLSNAGQKKGAIPENTRKIEDA